MAFLIFPHSPVALSALDIGPLFETFVHAGLGLRVFQAFARSIQPPKEQARGAYRFFFKFVQSLADNPDRESEVKPDPKYPEALTPTSKPST